MRVKVLVTLYAEVEINMLPHADGGGAAINPVVEDSALIIQYGATGVPDQFEDQSKVALATCAAALMTQMAHARLERRLGARQEPVTFGGPTQAPGSA